MRGRWHGVVCIVCAGNAPHCVVGVSGRRRCAAVVPAGCACFFRRWRGAGVDERGGLENRCPVFAGPWVRIPPPPPADQSAERLVCVRKLVPPWRDFATLSKKLPMPGGSAGSIQISGCGSLTRRSTVSSCRLPGQGISYEKYLRQGRRRHTYGWRGKKRFKRIRDYRKIGERPASVEERKEFGHWESDTLRGPRRQEAGIATHVERKTRFLVAVKLEDRKAETYNQRTIYAYLVRYPPFFPLFCDLCERRKKNPSQRKDD